MTISKKYMYKIRNKTHLQRMHLIYALSQLQLLEYNDVSYNVYNNYSYWYRAK